MARKPVSKKPGFAPDTGATLLVGRWFESSGTAKEVLRFFEAVWKLAPDEDFRIIPAADFSEWNSSAKRVFVTWALGLKVEATLADWGAIGISLDKVRKQEKLAAKALTPAFWKKVAKLAGEQNPPLVEQRDRALVVPWGPLASAYLVFGAEAGAGDEEAAPGTDMRQEAHEVRIAGQRVVAAEDWRVAEADLSPAAHRVRARERSGGEYFLVPRYD